MNTKKIIELKRKGEISCKELTIGEMVQLTEFFNIYIDGDKMKVILKEIV